MLRILVSIDIRVRIHDTTDLAVSFRCLQTRVTALHAQRHYLDVAGLSENVVHAGAMQRCLVRHITGGVGDDPSPRSTRLPQFDRGCARLP
jgi:hypothetical protein